MTEAEQINSFTCRSKGGTYELIGVARGAGLLKEADPLLVYRDVVSGTLYFRTISDFIIRMEPLFQEPNEPVIGGNDG